MRVSVSPDHGTPRELPWTLILARAVLALLLGLVLTFVPDRSSAIALAVFGGWALVTGSLIVALIAPLSRRSPLRTGYLAIGVATALAGIVALLSPAFGGVPLGLAVGIPAVLIGAAELVLSIRHRHATPFARDGRIVGGLTVLLGVVFLALPSDFAQSFSGDRGVTGTLSAPLILSGTLSAWGIVTGVLFVISALSLRWQTTDARPSEATAPTETEAT